MMFEINDYVMYKKDVCKIIDIKHQQINNQDYYIRTPIDDESLIIDVPINNRLNNLRSIISKDEAEKLIKRIKSIEPLTNINDKSIEST